MLHQAGLKPVPPLRSCCISRCGVSDGCSGIPFIARFSLCLRLYQGVILRISEDETGHIACWNCVFRMMKKYDLDASCWYTAVCTNLSFSAYSCPTERSCANTRLLGGRTENSDWKSAGYLKSVTYSFGFTFS